MSSSIKIGFIGLGQMGGPMARNLAKRGFPLIVYDKVEASGLALANSVPAKNVSVAKSISQVSSDSDIIFTMLPATSHVENVYLSSTPAHDALLDKPGKTKIFLDSSTIDPMASKRIHEKAKEKGLYFVDAPVSGGTLGADAGTLTFMLGNAKEDIKNPTILPILQAMGKNIVHCGQMGHGLVAKLCNNMLLAITMIGTSEALLLGKSLGMEPQLLSSIINTSTGRNWSCDTYNPVPGILPNAPASKQYKGGFGAQLMSKDLSLAVNSAYSVNSPIYLGSMCQQLYQHLSRNKDLSARDFSVVYQFLKDAGITNL